MSYYLLLLLLLSVIYAAASSASLPQQSSNTTSSIITPSSSNSAIVFETQITDSKNTANSSLQQTGIRSNYYHDEESANAARYGNNNNNAASHNVPQGSQYERPSTNNNNNPASSTYLTPTSSNHGVTGTHQNQHQENLNYGSNYNKNPIYISSTPRGVINSKYNSQGSDYQHEIRPVYNPGNYNQGVGAGITNQQQPATINNGNNYNPLQIPPSNNNNNPGPNYGVSNSNKNNNYPGSNYGVSNSNNNNYPSQINSGSNYNQYERPQHFNTGGSYNNNNYNILPQVITPNPHSNSNEKIDDNNRYPILVSSSNPHTIESQTPVLESQSRPSYERPAQEPSYAFVKPAEESETTAVQQNNECVCVSESHCPLLSTRIVTPEEPPCDRSSDVRCCFQDSDFPISRCGTRMNITVPDVATRPGQTRFGEHPWSVVLLTQDNEYVSGGALLDDAHVLTAAHKVHQYVNNVQDLKIRLGEWDAAANHEPYSYLEFPASEVFVYPEFSAKNLHGDVAVVSFRGNLDLRRYPHINSACLPRQGALFIGHRCWVAGWGQDSFGKGGAYQRVLKHIDVPVVPADECETRLRDTKLGQYFHLDRRSFVCAGGEPQKDACTGDGGSPLVCEDPQQHQFYVAGLVAWGIGCATHGIPGVYVNVAGYSDWITEQITNFKHLKY